MFPTRKNSQKRVKNQKSTDKHSSFDGLIQEDIDLSDIYLAVLYDSFSSLMRLNFAFKIMSNYVLLELEVLTPLFYPLLKTRLKIHMLYYFIVTFRFNVIYLIKYSYV